MFIKDLFNHSDIQFIKYIFKIPKPNLNFEIPGNILNLLPDENTNILDSLFVNDNDIIRNLSITYEERSKIIIALSKLLKQRITEEEYNYYSLIVLQSITCLFFTPFSEITPNHFFEIMDCLNLALNFKEISDDKKISLLNIILSRLNTCNTILYIPSITCILITHSTLKAKLSPKCYEIIKAIFQNAGKKMTSAEQNDASLFIKEVLPYLQRCVSRKDVHQNVVYFMGVLNNEKVTESDLLISIFSIIVELMSSNPNIDILLDAVDIISSKPPIIRITQTVKTNEYSDMPNTPIMGFHHVPYSKEAKIDTSKKRTITQIEHIFRHPLIKVSEIIIEQQIFNDRSQYYSIISEVLKRTNLGKFHYIIVLFIFISQKISFHTDISSFLTHEHLWSYLMNENLFASSEAIFNTQQSDIVVIRQTMFDIIGMLTDSQQASIEARKSLLHLLRENRKNALIFSEILFMTFPMLHHLYEIETVDDDLFDVLFEASIIQQHRHILGDTLSSVYRPYTFHTISSLIRTRHIVETIQKSAYSCQALCATLFEKMYCESSLENLHTVLSLYNDGITTENISNALHQLFLGLIPEITRDNGFDLFLSLIRLIERVLKERSVSISNLIIKTQLLSDIMSCCLHIETRSESRDLYRVLLSSLYTLQYSADYNPKIVPYATIGSQINAIGLDDSLYSLIIKNITCSTEVFNRVSQPDALQMLLFAVIGTEKYPHILKKILSLSRDSICNRCSIHVSDVIPIIFDHIDESTYDTTIEIFATITETICSKSSLIAFIRHFSQFYNNKMNDKLLTSLSCLKNILSKAKHPEHFGLIQLTSPLSFIQLPNYTIEDIKCGVLIDFEVLLDKYTGERTLIEFGTGTIRFVISLVENRISVSSVDSFGEQQENSISISLPVAKFFRFTIFFVLSEFFSFFIDNVFIKGMPGMNLRIEDKTEFNCNLLFKSMSANSTQMQIKNFMLKTFDKKPTDFSSIPKCPAKMSVSFTAVSFSKGKLIMQTEKEKQLVDVRGICIPFFSNFMKIFEASHTIDFITSLFGSSNTPDALQANLFSELIDIYGTLISKSSTIPSQIDDINGFSVIAYFLDDLPPSYLSSDLWKVFVIIFSILEENSPKQKFCSEILFNLDIWRKADFDTQIIILKDIIVLCHSDKNHIIHYLRPQTVINYIVGIKDCDNMALFDAAIELFTLSTDVVFDAPEQHCFFLFLNSCNNYDLSVSLLKSIRHHSPKLSNNIEWCSLFLHPSEVLRLVFMEMYVSERHTKQNKMIALFSLISNTSNPLCGDDDTEKSFIAACLAKCFGESSDFTLRKFVENEEFNDVVINIVPLIFAFVSIRTSQHEMISLFKRCIEKILHNPKNIEIIRNSLDTIFILVILFFILTDGKELIPLIGPIFAKSNILSDVIGIIDNIQFCCRVDLTNERLQILSSVLDYIPKTIPEEQLYLYDILIQGILFHTKCTSSNKLVEAYEKSVFFERETETEVPQNSQNQNSLAFLFTLILHFVTKEAKKPTYYFGLFYENGFWIEETIAQKALFSGFAQCSRMKHKTLDSIYYLLYSFLRFSSDDLYINSYAPIVVEMEQKTDRESSLFSLIIFFLRQYNEDELSCIYPLFEQYKAEIRSPKTLSDVNRLVFAFSSQCRPKWMSKTYKSLRKTFTDLMLKHTSFNVPLSSEVSEALEKVLHRESEHFNRRHAEHSWRRLWQSMSFTHNPFLASTSVPHFKRGKQIAFDFCPVLSKRNTDFTIHAEASKNVSLSESVDLEKIPSHFNFTYEARDLKPMKYIEGVLKWRAPCDMIKVQSVTKGEFDVYGDKFVFTSEDNSKVTKIAFDDVRYIFFMNVLQRPTAIEIFTHTHMSYFFNFPSIDSRSVLNKYITSNAFHNAEFVQTKSGSQELDSLQLTQKWLNRDISTFTYLMWLNQLSGRSFNNTENYPVFPWILSDYTSPTLDLRDASVYRDLKKPVGALNEERLSKIKANTLPDENGVPILYRSTYSCPFHVYYFLLRFEPYTSLHIDIQDGHFDVPSRLFYSVYGAWQSASGLVNNFKELIPEFFFMHDFLLNTDRFALGTLTDGSVIDDVELPCWASNAEEFVQIHREALESEHVSCNIGHWIDLIWGYKQKGDASIAADNVFDQRLYDDVWRKNSDPEDRPEIESMLKHVGIIPEQLFTEPHPNRPQQQQQQKQQQRIAPYCYNIAEQCVDVCCHNGTLFFLSDTGSVYSAAKGTQAALVSKNECDMSCHCALESLGVFALVAGDSNNVSLFSSNGKVTTKENRLHTEGITCVTSCGTLLFTGGKDGVFAEWGTNRSVMSHSEGILCCCCSDELNVAVTCGSDGVLVIMTASPLKFVRAVDMKLPAGTVAQSVSIGRNGTIAVVSGHQSAIVRGDYVSLFSINGRKYAEQNIGSSALSVVTNKSGITSIVIATPDHGVIMYSGSSLKLNRFITRCDSQISLLKYDHEKQLLFIISNTGKVTVCSLPSS